MAAQELRGAVPAPHDWFHDCKGLGYDSDDLAFVTERGLRDGLPLTLVNVATPSGWSWAEVKQFAKPTSSFISVQGK